MAKQQTRSRDPWIWEVLYWAGYDWPELPSGKPRLHFAASAPRASRGHVQIAPRNSCQALARITASEAHWEFLAHQTRPVSPVALSRGTPIQPPFEAQLPVLATFRPIDSRRAPTSEAPRSRIEGPKPHPPIEPSPPLASNRSRANRNRTPPPRCRHSDRGRQALPGKPDRTLRETRDHMRRAAMTITTLPPRLRRSEYVLRPEIAAVQLLVEWRRPSR